VVRGVYVNDANDDVRLASVAVTDAILVLPYVTLEVNVIVLLPTSISLIVMRLAPLNRNEVPSFNGMAPAGHIIVGALLTASTVITQSSVSLLAPPLPVLPKSSIVILISSLVAPSA
jgi:hypothetical protein